MMHQYPEPCLFIGGEFTKGAGGHCEVINPASGERLADLPFATTGDLDTALAAADAAFTGWSETLPLKRSDIIRKAAANIRRDCERIATILTLEQGKPLAESRGEIMASAAIFEWSAEEGRRSYGRVIPGVVDDVHHYTRHEPIGPIAAFTPWNFPALTPARKIGAALAAGCPVVLKPSEETPGTAVAIARAFDEAGLPPGVLNIVFGNPAQISEHLIASPIIRKITFTGSTAVGRQLTELAARYLKPNTMELGGHAPVVVCEDADLDAIVGPLVSGKFRNAGQVCIAPTRFYVHRAIEERFVQDFVERTKAVAVGPGLDPGVDMGPLANQRRLEAIEEIVADLVDRGAKVDTGGTRSGNAGFFYQPTVATDVDPAARIMNEEPFGPVAPVIAFDDEEEMIAAANRLDYGLAAYAFSGSARRSRHLAQRIRAGMIGVNTLAVSHPETPFGGIGESGHGREGGIEGVSSYLELKLVAQG